jgi:hypothetical protein
MRRKVRVDAWWKRVDAWGRACGSIWVLIFSRY